MLLETGALASALAEVNIKPEIIEQVVSSLTSVSDDMGSDSLTNVGAIPAANFGHRASASTLFTHFDKALQVTQATIDGLTQDLVDFAHNSKQAYAYATDADATTAAGMSQTQAAIDRMDLSAQAPNSENAYNDARNGRHDHGGQGGNR